MLYIYVNITLIFWWNEWNWIYFHGINHWEDNINHTKLETDFLKAVLSVKWAPTQHMASFRLMDLDLSKQILQYYTIDCCNFFQFNPASISWTGIQEL